MQPTRRYDRRVGLVVSAPCSGAPTVKHTSPSTAPAATRRVCNAEKSAFGGRAWWFGGCWALVVMAAWMAGLMTTTGCSEPATTSQDALVDGAAGSGDTTLQDSGDDAGTTPVLIVDGIASVTPAQGPSSGGVEVVIKGRGFTLTDSVWFGESKAVDVQVIDDETLRVTTPPRPPGITDVIVLRYDPDTKKGDDLTSVAAFRTFATVRVDSVSPASGPSFGGAVTTISGAGFRPGTHFVFDRRLAVDPVILDEFTATMLTPPGVVGLVEVSASNGDGAATLQDGYTYVEKVEPQVSGVTVLPVKPDILDAAGGTPIEVRWSSAVALKLIGVRVGGLMAGKLAVKSTSASAVAPKGSPGPADVTLVFESGVATLTDAVHYNVSKPFVAALLPGRGAQAGGTVVDVVGGGLHRLTTLHFADKLGVMGAVPHPGLARVVSPRGDPGTVDVTAHFSGAPKQILYNAWAWFDPQQAGWGTWGGSIRGALNVTVRRSDWPGGIVQGALVVIGEAPVPALSGMTDDRGQVTLSAHDLRGPVNVHASAPGFGAGSVIAFDAQHVTILIRKHPTPPTSAGTPTTIPKEIFTSGTVSGRVRYVDKLLKLPMGSCDAGPSNGQCAPCTDTCGSKLACSGLLDAVGGLSLAASATTTNQRYCLRSCLGSTDCDPGWECRAVGTQGQSTWNTRCVPQIGKPETRCETTTFSQFSLSPDPGPYATAAADGSFSLNTRLGEMAVMCKSGYVKAGSDTFVPLIMGVARGVKVPDDKTTVKTEVWLDTPLTRVAHFALEPLPMGPETAAHRRFVRAWLDLGGEGFLELGSAHTFERTDRLDVAQMPSVLKGGLAGLHWTVYAGMEFDDDDEGAPSSLAMNRDVRIESGDHAAWWLAGTSGPSEAEAWAPPVIATASGQAGLFAVGEAGLVLRWGGTAFTAQQSPTNRDLHAVWLDATSSDGWIGGDDGVLLRRDAILGWQVAGSPTSARILALSGGVKGPWMLDASGKVLHFDGKSWSAVPGPAGAKGLRTLAAQTIQASPPATALIHDELWLAGEDGVLFHGVPLGAGAWSWTQAAGATTGTTWLAVLPEGKAVWLAGEAGALALAQNGVITPIVSGTTQPLRALAATKAGGAFLVGGAGTWLEVTQGGPVVNRSIKGLEVDLRGISEVQGTWVAAGEPTIRLKPYLALPNITEPTEDAKVGDKIVWTVKPGPSAEMHQVQITTFWLQSHWQIYAPGGVTEIPLANFSQLGGWNPLPDGPLRVRVWRLFGPKLEVDHFNHNEMSAWYWQAWSYNWQLAHK